MKELSPSVNYRVDSEDRITLVGPSWLSFARDNGAQQLTPKSVIGRPLWDFVEGQQVQKLYKMFLGRVRRTSQSATLAFRCDSPTVRRFMELKMVPASANELQFEARTLKVESRNPVPILDTSLPRSHEVLSICSWCKRILSAGEEWLEVDTAVARLQLFDMSPVPQLSEDICPRCHEVAKRELSRLRG